MDTSVLDSSIASSMTEDMEEESGVAVAAAVDGQHHGLQTRRRTQTNRKPRTKGLVKKLQQQIDFYFGDSNLPKDKFLQQKMKEDPDGYVPLDVIANFKKMKALSEDLSLIRKAIENSSVTELSEDKTKVRRSQPLPEVDTADVDSRTIYVENLPMHLTEHATIKKLFKMFGEVVYISIPRHKSSGVAKGFAFIEFSSTEEATASLEFFKNKDKMTQMPKGRKPSTVLSKEDEMEGCSADASGGEVMQNDETKGGQKRKREEETTSSDSSEQLPATKRIRTTSPCSKDQSSTVIHLHGNTETLPTSSDQQNVSHPATNADSAETQHASQLSDEPSSVWLSGKRRRSCDDETSGEGQTEVPPIKSARLESQSSETDDLNGGVAEDGGHKKKKKNRQHKKKQHSSLLKDLDIRVMAKSEWLELKKLYCDMQKEQMKHLKKELHGLNEREGKRDTRRETKSFIGQCLVRVECGGEGGANVEQIKEVCSRHGPVAYVDIKDGDKEGYVRYKISGCVDKLVETETSLSDTTFSSVNEEDERAYFLKCQAQRKQQFKNKGKRNQRGQDKLVSKALKKFDHASKQPTHIRFSDDEDDS